MIFTYLLSESEHYAVRAACGVMPGGLSRKKMDKIKMYKILNRILSKHLFFVVLVFPRKKVSNQTPF